MEAESPAFYEDPRYICEETIRTEEQNLAGVYVRRKVIALAFTLGEENAQKEAKALDAAEARIRRRIAFARLALAEIRKGKK